MKKLIVGISCLLLISATTNALAVDDATVQAIENKASSANAKAEGNNSRIQGIEAVVADLQSQIDALDAVVVINELCNLYELTEQPPPPLCLNCGNGEWEPLEECEDGNTLDGDGCSSNCLLEVCGNGRIDYNEECDDGNIEDGDRCSNNCTIEYRTVFVTSQEFTGALGGLAEADAKCNELAASANLEGEYQAWLSDSNTSVADRFRAKDGVYIDVLGNLIADSWTDLTDGNLDHPIQYDETGTLQNAPYTRAWTGTDSRGLLRSNSGNNCDDWNTDDWNTGEPTPMGLVGVATVTNFYWTQANFLQCNSLSRLYCFQQ